MNPFILKWEGDAPPPEHERPLRLGEYKGYAAESHRGGSSGGSGGGGGGCIVTLLLMAAGGTSTVYGLFQLLT